MSNYYTANVKTKFKAYINDVEFTEQDEYYAVKRFLEKFCNPIEEIKSENPDFKFDKIPNQLIRHFIYTIFEASEHGNINYHKKIRNKRFNRYLYHIHRSKRHLLQRNERII